jgi:site-specific DNA recombinase
LTPRGSTSTSAWSETSQDTPPAAVIYLRVSTKDQATRGGEAEGFSIPAQRDACRRKAASLGAAIAEEFVDRGESARSAHRAGLQEMLVYVQQNRVDYVIVHKVDRLARNRVDDVEINVALKNAGATLVSCTENIDETPSGILLHGIMSSIAEFYSRNLANEVNKGLIQKAKNGGTPMRTPVGYINVRKIEDGREIRTVEIDPDRAPFVIWAFKAYATGEWTTRTLLAEVTKRGLLSKATPKRPEQPIALSAFGDMLRNPYYVGIVRYRGVDYQGKHEPLIDKETFEQVQRQLEAHNFAGQKQRVHHHYLKGTLFCGKENEHGEECGCRLIVCNAKSRNKTIYPYYVCIGRQRSRTSCFQRALPIDFLEDAVADFYSTVELGPELRLQTEQLILEEITEFRKTAGTERQQLVTKQRRALDKRAKLLDAHLAGAVPLDLLKTEQDRITNELDHVEERLAVLELKFDVIESNLKAALAYVGNLHRAYSAAGPRVRRQINQAIFNRILVSSDGDIVGELRPPFDLLLRASGTADQDGILRPPAKDKPRASQKARGLSKQDLVDPVGLEPTTSSMPC